MTAKVNGTETLIADVRDTPDYRIEEPHFVPYNRKYIEHERPYLNSPAFKEDRYGVPFGCYCNTVYKRLTLLAGCAVISSRHVLTTATPTMLIVRSYRHRGNLDGILGGWYDGNNNGWNSSFYFQAARIHVHPQYTYDYEVNVSHPIPAMYDLALVTLQNYIYSGGYYCQRAGSGRYSYGSTIPTWSDLSIVAGFQFIKSYNRKPMPWYRYIVFTKQYVWPCPKSDWQWFHCIYGDNWGRLGFDSGGGLNTYYRSTWRYDGLSGLCAFSLKLRSKQTVHYFTVLDTYPVLDFLYDAMLGLSKCAWIDDRFEDTKWSGPVPYIDVELVYAYDWPKQQYNVIPFY